MMETEYDLGVEYSKKEAETDQELMNQFPDDPELQGGGNNRRF